MTFTAIDIFDQIELYIHFEQSVNITINKSAVNLIICYAYKEMDMLPYSSHCLTISAMATEIRCQKKLGSFDEILCLISSGALKVEVSTCAETLYQKMIKYAYFSGNPTDSNDWHAV